jgi:hypothetical protein
MGVLGFMTLIESKCLEASEAHKIGVANLFDRDALLVQRGFPSLHGDRRPSTNGKYLTRKCCVGRQRLDLAARQLGLSASNSRMTVAWHITSTPGRIGTAAVDTISSSEDRRERARRTRR